MGRTAKVYSVEELTALLDATRNEICRLENDRRHHEQEIRRIDRRLSALRGEGTNGGMPGQVPAPRPHGELRERIAKVVGNTPDGLTVQEIVPAVGRPITQTGIVKMAMGRMVKGRELRVKHEKGVEKYVPFNRPGQSA